MKETVAYCDLDDKEARRAGVAVLRFEIDGVTHVVDVCQVHLTLLSRLPSGTAVRGRRRGARRATKRATKRVAAAAPAKAAKKAAPARKRAAAKATKAPAKRATKAPAKKAAKATRRVSAAGRVSGSRRDQQQRIAAARDWARAQGRSISDKGRLPAGLLEEFAHASR